ncbi:HNH endonuclease [Streptomyces sp. NPDC059904]|uniref:HNH endonuclease signature motif containing protein n=1 Tax=unclassified Streptomyces TaxID=2593676 RepID=UPI0036662BBA
MRLIDATMGSGPARYLRARLTHYAIDTSHFQDEPLPERPRRSYSKDILVEAAECSRSIREMFIHMGIPPEDGPYWHVRKRLKDFGIDTSHFAPARGEEGAGLFPEDELIRAVAQAHGLADLLRRLGVRRPSAAARTRVKRSIDEYGLSTEHFVGQGHGIGIPSPGRRTADEILVPPGTRTRRTPTALLRRALDDIGAPHVCAECGVRNAWRGKRLVLEIDHVNGDRLDNRRANLRYLCPSCHSQTRTFSNRRRAAQYSVPKGPVSQLA